MYPSSKIKNYHLLANLIFILSLTLRYFEANLMFYVFNLKMFKYILFKNKIFHKRQAK